MREGFFLTHFQKHKEVILYLFFGGLTTFVSIISYFAFRFFYDVKISQIFSWVFAVLFAYVTNKFFVFNSHQKKIIYFFKEFIMFIFARLFTGIMEFLLLIFFVNKNMTMKFEILIKIFVTILVIILNYLLSKLIVFYKKHN